MIRMLIWKEWREQRWKLPLCVLMLGGFTLIGLQSRLVEDRGIVIMGTLIAGMVLPILAAMDLVAGDRAAGTLTTLLSLPVAPWKVLAVKLAFGLLVCVAPVAAAWAVAMIVAGGRELTVGHITYIYLGAAGLSSTIMIWTLAWGITQPTEARCALVGIGVIAALSVVALAYEQMDNQLPEWVMTLYPLAFMSGINERYWGWLKHVFWVQAALAAGLAWWASRRMGRLARATR